VDPVAALLIGGIGSGLAILWRAFIKADIVPGSLYRDAVARAERAETQAERNTDALEEVTATVKLALEQRSASDG
jgi:hypothetical protein